MMNIGLLECDHVAERFRHIAGDYREMFADLLDQHAPQLRLKSFDASGGQLPDSPEACDAYLCTGSRHSVYDDLDWIRALKGFIREIHEAGRPFVGICFGHQLLAEALGGRTAPAPQGWGVGVHEMRLIREEAWMRPWQRSCSLQYMHQDQVRLLPAEGVLLGQSDHCPIAMFRVGDTMLGIQAHLEFPPDYSEGLMLDRLDRIGEAKVEAARAGLRRATDEGMVTRWIADFLARAASSDRFQSIE